jgi:uncharacterized protein with HEPN domain
VSHRESGFRIQDMLDAAEKIMRYIEGVTFEGFLRNEMLADAVIRQLTIIGEAASHVPEEIRSLDPDIPWRSIRGMRNVTVHRYFCVDMRIVWKTVTLNTPDLVARLETLRRRLPRWD